MTCDLPVPGKQLCVTLFTLLVNSKYKYEVVSERSWTIIAVTTSVKAGERGGQGHISASPWISLPHGTLEMLS
jgi:hypothetical protein